jgi:DUF971 family protein
MSQIPLAVANHPERRALCIEWPDQPPQWLDHALLRRNCPCSQCRAFKLAGTPPHVADAVRLLGVAAQGYGLQLMFSDGHQRGIYPWVYLIQLSA